MKETNEKQKISLSSFVNNRLHITFGKFAEMSLTNSFALNNKLDGETMALTNNLSIGPIKNLDSKTGQLYRSEWLSNISNDPETRKYLLESDNLSYNSIKAATRNQAIYIWRGDECGSRIGYMRLMHELLHLDGEIHILDYPKLIDYPIGRFPFLNIGIIKTEEIESLNKHFRPLTIQDKQSVAYEWLQISKHESTLRVINAERNIEHVADGYFDNMLLSFCTTNFKKSALVIGETLNEIFSTWQSIEDSFLGWRIRELIRANILEHEGDLDLYRNFTIRLRSNNVNDR